MACWIWSGDKKVILYLRLGWFYCNIYKLVYDFTQQFHDGNVWLFICFFFIETRCRWIWFRLVFNMYVFHSDMLHITCFLTLHKGHNVTFKWLSLLSTRLRGWSLTVRDSTWKEPTRWAWLCAPSSLDWSSRGWKRAGKSSWRPSPSSTRPPNIWSTWFCGKVKQLNRHKMWN